MARDRTPDPLTRRHLMERTLDPAQALRIAETYLAEDRRCEAVAFLGRAEESDRLETLRGEALAEGDVFLLKSVCQALGRDPLAEEWSAVGEAAEACGKLRYAALARRQIEGSEG